MKQLLSATALAITLGFAAPALAGSHNPCNPCSMHNNPCHMEKSEKKHNPCNPCDMKKMKSHENPCNPCSMKKHNPCSK